MAGAHNEKERGRERSAKHPRSRLKFQIFLTVVELPNLEGDDVAHDWLGGLAAIAMKTTKRSTELGVCIIASLLFSLAARWEDLLTSPSISFVEREIKNIAVVWHGAACRHVCTYI